MSDDPQKPVTLTQADVERINALFVNLEERLIELTDRLEGCLSRIERLENCQQTPQLETTT